jgi:hypothetical protein
MSLSQLEAWTGIVSSAVTSCARALVILALPACSSMALAQTYPSPPHQLTSPIAGARFEIVQSPLAARWTFRLDRYAGRVWQFVTTQDANSTWQEMVVIDLPKLQAQTRPRYQIFTSGLAARHTFLIDSETGKTWVLAKAMRTNSDGTQSEYSLWQQFAE